MFRDPILSSVLVGLALFPAACAEQGEPEVAPWDRTVEDIRSEVGAVRAGRDLTPESWPGGAQVAVALSFDFDSETNALRDGEDSPGEHSRGEYAARAAMPRILQLLDEHGVPASFFIPAVTAILHPAEVEAIVAKGVHEIGLHGWIHERNSLLSEEIERELMG